MIKSRATIRFGLLVATAAVWAMVPAAALAQAEAEFTPVTDAMIQDPAPEDWLTWRRTLNSWGYSPLDQVDRSNVGDLRMIWTRGLTEGSNQGTPLV
ncbi:MAG TPA: pyrrolo-quinoline quinone, partial [Acidobacteria bacterium]|nr:pyrrolo-quinoline quinone [Acidobacteriota bacterium]